MVELTRRYLDEHAYPKKKPSSVVGDESHLKLHILPSLGRLRVSDVKRADIATLHHSLRSAPYTANRVLSLLSKMFSLAERWGLRPDGSNPCLHVERYRENARERYLLQQELDRLGDVLRDVERQQLESPSVVAAIRLLLLTGARRGEILNLRWEYINFERATINLPDSKTGAKTIPLNAPALEVLTGLDQTSEWVLPGARSDAPLVNLSRPWSRIRRRAQLDGVRIHDLRHSFASVAAGAGASLPVIGRLLGHSQPATTQRYAHLADDIVHSTAEEVGERLGPALSGMRLATVVPLKRR
jgi:integrase